MKTRFTLFFGTLIFLSNIALLNAQLPVVFEEWASENGSQNMFMEAFTVNDATQNIYVGGATLNSNGDYDLFLCKYNDRGTLLWSQVYAGAGNGDDAAAALAFGLNGEVYVTGTVYQGTSNKNDALLLKYDASGTLQWAQTFNGNASDLDFGTSLYIDANNDIYLGGACSENTTNLLDFLILKYDLDGNLLWSNNWDGANLGDIAHKIGFVAGNPVLAGGAQINATKWEYALVKFNSGDGSFIGQNISNTAGTGIDQIKDLKVDAAGNIYVTGCVNTTLQGTDVKTVKLSSNLSILWDMQYNYTANENDLGNAIELDATGNVYVSGYCTDNSREKILTLKYNSSGSLLWERTIASPGDGNAQGADLVCTAASDLIVGGFIFNGSNTDYYTMKYSSTGDSIWSITYNGIYNQDDKILDLCLDDNGDIIVVGQSNQGNEFKYITVKYSEKEVIIPPDDETTGGLSYLENRGQLLTTAQQVADRVKFYTRNGGPALFFQDDTISYVLTDSNATTGLMDYYRIDMQFIEASAEMKVRSFNEQDHYSNFYLGHIPEGRARVKNFSNVLYYNLYYNIDLQFSSNNRGSKYYYIVKPGGDPGDIRLNYNGADSVAVNTGDSLILYTGIGNIVFPQAKAYQISATGSKINLSWSPDYSLNGNQLSFSLNTYNTSLPLVIEVGFGQEAVTNTENNNLKWSYLHGGPKSIDGETFNDVDVRRERIYITGYTEDVHFPLVNGVYSTSNFGSWDAILMVIDTHHNTFWDSYYGGSGSDGAFCTVAEYFTYNPGVYIGGLTRSVDIPVVDNSGNNADTWYYSTTSYNYDNTDMFFAKFSDKGELIWSTYYGGSVYGYEVPRDMILDGSSTGQSLYIVGESPSNLPLETMGNYYSTVGNGFILKFNNSLQRTWCTKFPVTTINSVAIDASENSILLTGTINSSPWPTLFSPINYDPNYTDPTLTSTFTNNYNGGGTDAFVAKFDQNTNLIFAEYLGGIGEDFGNCVQIDNNKIYVCGSTNSVNFLHKDNNPSNPNDFCNYLDYIPNQDILPDAFIIKMSNVTNSTTPSYIEWATHFGGSMFDEGVSINFDSKHNLYLIGNTNSGAGNSNKIPFPSLEPSNFLVYENYFSNGTPNYAWDFFVSAFNPDTEHFWSTYFGGSGLDIATSSFIWPGPDVATKDKLFITGSAWGYHIHPDYVGENFILFKTKDDPLCTYDEVYYTPGFSEYDEGDCFAVKFSLDAFYWNNIGERKYLNSFSVFPNPCNKNIKVKNNDAYDQTSYSLIIYNILGSKVFSTKFQKSININIESFVQGIYYIEVMNSMNSLSLTYPIVKQ